MKEAGEIQMFFFFFFFPQYFFHFILLEINDEKPSRHFRSSFENSSKDLLLFSEKQ